LGASSVNALGAGVTVVNERGRLVISHQVQPVLGNVILNGGELAPGSATTTHAFGGTLQLTASSSILTFDGVTYDDVPAPCTLAMLQPISIPSAMTLTVMGNGTLLAGAIQVGGELAVDTQLLDTDHISGAGSVNLLTGKLAATSLRVSSLALADRTSVSIKPNGISAATSVLNQLSLAGGNAPRAKFDLANNAMVIDYAASSPIETVRAQIQSGFAGGKWSGNGISSSLADATYYGLGYGEASALGSVPVIFGSVDDTSLLIRYTRYGDANLDGTVNLTDFNALAANFGILSGGLWTQGDFNYDGKVNLADFNKMASNFGLTAIDHQPTPQDWQTLAAAVPEPASAGLLALAAVGALCRRRQFDNVRRSN
jgi:hypothetical protein